MKVKEVEIAKEVIRSDGWWRFACGDVCKRPTTTNKIHRQARTSGAMGGCGIGGCGNCAKDSFDNHEPSPDDPTSLMAPFICLMTVTMVSMSVTRKTVSLSLKIRLGMRMSRMARMAHPLPVPPPMRSWWVKGRRVRVLLTAGAYPCYRLFPPLVFESYQFSE